MSNRKPIPKDVEHRVLDRSRRRCALCVHFENDWTRKEGQLAHLDRNPSNSAEENLIFLCLPHHDDYDTTRRQTKNVTITEATTARDRLYEYIEKGGDLANAGRRKEKQTLEATRGSVIDATDATIPGDLPFQFARADNRSVISMPGIRVTKQPDGSFLVEPGSAPGQPTARDGASLRERKIQSLETLVRHLCDARDFFGLAVKRVGFRGDLSREEYQSRCADALGAAQRTLMHGRLLIPADLVQLCDDFFRKMSQGLATFELALDPAVPDGKQRGEFWDEASRIARNEIPGMLGQIEDVARRLVQDN